MLFQGATWKSGRFFHCFSEGTSDTDDAHFHLYKLQFLESFSQDSAAYYRVLLRAEEFCKLQRKSGSEQKLWEKVDHENPFSFGLVSRLIDSIQLLSQQISIYSVLVTVLSQFSQIDLEIHSDLTTTQKVLLLKTIHTLFQTSKYIQRNDTSPVVLEILFCF